MGGLEGGDGAGSNLIALCFADESFDQGEAEEEGSAGTSGCDGVSIDHNKIG